VLPIAHAGHWLWILYAVPVLVVIGSIVSSTLRERREAREGDEDAPDEP
jgi:hypothetical protein